MENRRISIAFIGFFRWLAGRLSGAAAFQAQAQAQVPERVQSNNRGLDSWLDKRLVFYFRRKRRRDGIVMDIGNLTVSTDMLIGLAAGAGISLVRGILVKAVIGLATTYLLVGGNVDLNQLYRSVVGLIP